MSEQECEPSDAPVAPCPGCPQCRTPTAPSAERRFLIEPEPRRFPLPEIKRMTASRILFGLPGFGDRVRRVPARAVLESDAEGVELLLECPCGAKPVVTSVIAPCPGECERWYVCAQGYAYVVYGDMQVPS